MHIPALINLLVTSLFCFTVLGLRVPIKDVREQGKNIEKREEQAKEVQKEKRAQAELANVFHQHEKRLTCIYDGVLAGLQNSLEDAVPFCSSYIGIGRLTATATSTAKTTTTTLTTVIETFAGPTVTVAANTVTQTVTKYQGQELEKRQVVGGSIVPFPTLSAACEDTALNNTLKSAVRSGCSCLRIQSETDTVTGTVTSTRTLSGVEYVPSTQIVTVTTSGTTTVTVTIPGPNIPSNTRDGGQIPSNTGGSVPVITGTYGTANVTSAGTGIASSGTGTGPRSSGTAPVPTGSVSSSAVSYTGRPTFNPDTRGGNSFTQTSLSPSVSIPPSSYNSTVPSGTISRPSNSSSYLPTASPSADANGCPYRNGTKYIAQCQEFTILCYKNYAGPTFLGLSEATLNDCIEDCATVNVGFSQDRCYGLSFNTSGDPGRKNCFFKTEEGTKYPVDDDEMLGAKLTNNNTCVSNVTSIPLPTGSLTFNISSRIAPTAPLSSASFSISYSGNSSAVNPTAPPFSLPTDSRGLNSTSSGFSSGFPSNSYNFTSITTNATSSTACPSITTVTTSITTTTTEIYSVIKVPPRQ